MADDLRGGSLQLCRLRIAKLAATGEPLVGAGNLYVTEDMILLNDSPEIGEGEEFELNNGCGVGVVSTKDEDELRWLNLTLQLAKPDPVLSEFLVGGTVLLDGAEEVGWAYPPVGPFAAGDVSIEAWTKHIVNGDQDGAHPWIRWVFPKTRWRLGDRNRENAPQITNFAGIAFENDAWDNGPANDWVLESGRVEQYALDPGPLPAAQFGAQVTPADVP